MFNLNMILILILKSLVNTGQGTKVQSYFKH